MEEFADLRDELYILLRERTEAPSRYRELRNLPKGEMPDDVPGKDTASAPDYPQ